MNTEIPEPFFGDPPPPEYAHGMEQELPPPQPDVYSGQGEGRGGGGKGWGCGVGGGGGGGEKKRDRAVRGFLVQGSGCRVRVEKGRAGGCPARSGDSCDIFLVKSVSG